MTQRLVSYGLALLAWSAAASNTQVASSLVDLSLEELSNIRVTSVSRRAEPLATAAASVFVITGEDIRRAGAIMEALRLAPNLQVARSASTGYAITARGFNQTLANKLLVLIDGQIWDNHENIRDNLRACCARTDRPSAALVKDLGTTLEQEIPEIARQLIDAEPDRASTRDFVKVLAHTMMNAPSFSIRGGTREILRGMIARGLGLR